MRQKVLLVLQRIPYPPIGGDNVTYTNLIKILGTQYDLDVVVVTNEESTQEAINFLEKYSHEYKIFKFPRWKFILNSLKTLVNFKPLQVNYFYFKAVQEYINSKIDSYDVVIAGIVRTAEYLRNCQKPKIFHMADSVGLNYKHSFKRTKSLFWKMIYFVEFPILLRYERKMIEIFDRTLMFNKREIEYFNSPKIEKMPQAVKDFLLTYESPDATKEKYITFFGKMNYQPNIDAVLWFTKNVFPHLPEEISFQIVGAYPVKEILELEELSYRIFVRGFVEDPYKLLKSSICVVAPMQTGAGIQNKILEAMAVGSIVVTTSYSAFPIARKEDYVLLIADTPQEWIKLIVDIYKNPEKYSHIRKNAREYIKHNFTFEKFRDKLMLIIDEVLKSRNNIESELQ
jgi:glycosyltransferase involved in cell wall biosynthesis